MSPPSPVASQSGPVRLRLPADRYRNRVEARRTSPLYRPVVAPAPQFPVHSEVIAIGDELTSGQRLDTNSQWLSVRLGDCGIPAVYHTTVGDALVAMVEVFRVAIERADVVVVTGGLGPTADDLTRDALAASTDVPLKLDGPSLGRIEAMFQQRKRPMPDSNRRQALFPKGSRPIENPHGTAPGIAFEIPRSGREPCRFYALPGVPAEMRQMFQQTVEPEIRSLLPNRQVVVHRRIKCFGAGESHLESMLPDLIRRDRDPRVGITVSEATITLRITTMGVDDASCRLRIAPTEQTIRESLGELVFGEEDDELHDVVGRLLAARRLRLATYEVGTGGLLCSWLSNCAEPVLASGLVAVEGDPTVTAESMLASTAAHIALHVVAPLHPGSEDRVEVTIARPGAIVRKSFGHVAHPAIQKPLAAKRALNLLRLELLKSVESQLGP